MDGLGAEPSLGTPATNVTPMSVAEHPLFRGFYMKIPSYMTYAMYAIYEIYETYIIYSPYIAGGAGDKKPATRAGFAVMN